MCLAYKLFAAIAGKDAKLREKLLLVALIMLLVVAGNVGLANAGRGSLQLLSDAHDAISRTQTPDRPTGSVVDCLLTTGSSTDTEFAAKASVHINYPSIGNKMVDKDIREWVTDMAEAFSSHMGLLIGTEENEARESLLESALDQAAQLSKPEPAFELWGGYRISRPSSAAVSIAFEFWNYTGASEGTLDIITLNYSLLTGQRLNLADIFEKPDVALELMSSWSRKVLESRLGAARRARMLAEGTEPVLENFSSLTLTPEGICINFQPWQVAPKDAGIQKVIMPLEELLPSAPLLALWGKG